MGSTTANNPEGPANPTGDPDRIKDHVARILRSPPFARAPRMQRFLAFLTAETAAGRAAQLKEYTIAVNVFGKAADFDPGTSAVVRVEAGRLRKLLLQYRVEHGGEDTIVLEIPKGSYVPTFSLAAQPATEDPRVVKSSSSLTESVERDSRVAPMQPSLWSASQERRQITVVSCTFGDAHGAACHSMAGEFISSFELFYDRCTSIGKRHGGSFDGGSSDRLIVYFGWPNALEDSAGRALTAALEMLAAVKEAFGSGPWGVRMSVATSDAVTRTAAAAEAVQRPAVIGEAPLLATQILSHVPLNGILVAESTRRITGAAFHFIPAGSLERSSGELNLLWRLLGAKPISTRFRAAHAGTQSSIIGRREELALLLSRWQLSRQGEGQGVVLVGEAGIGKSRLAESLLEEVDDGGAQLRVQCSPHHANSTLYPFVEIIRSQLEMAGEGEAPADCELEGFLARWGLIEPRDRALLGALLSRSSDELLSGLSASQQKDLTLKLLVRWLISHVNRRPTALLVEDVHWADPTTLELLQDVLRLSSGVRLLVLLTSREDLACSDARQTNITSIRLTRLPKRDCNALIDRMLNAAPLSAAARSLILDKAEGIPLFLEELTKLLLAAGESRAGESALIPQSLSDLLVSQLDKLGATRSVAQVAAVIGRQFTREMLRQGCAYCDEDIDTALDQLLAAGILVSEGTEAVRTFSFRHALLRDAAYGSVLDHSRRQLHYRVGSVLLEAFPEVAIEHPEIIARHMIEAARPDEAIPFWIDAGRKAASRYALTEAITDFRLALDALSALPESRENRERELEVYIELGLVTRNARGYGDVELSAIYERSRALAADLGKPEQLAHSVYGLWTHAAGRGEWKKAVTLAIEFENLTRRMEDTQLEVEAFRLLGASSALMGEFSIATRHFQRALSIYDSSRHGPRFGFDPGAVSAAYLAWTSWHLGKPEEARSHAARALELAEAKNHAPTVGVVLSWLMFYKACEGDAAAILEYNERLQTVCAERDCRYWQPFGTACAEWAGFQRDREARHLDRLLEAVRQFRELYFTSCLLLLAADLCAVLRRPEQGLEITELASRFIDEHDERVWESECSRRRAEFLLQIPGADLQEARQLLLRAMRVARHQEASVLEQRAVEALAALDATPV
jgi:class 3 adenylate cyclase